MEQSFTQWPKNIIDEEEQALGAGWLKRRTIDIDIAKRSFDKNKSSAYKPKRLRRVKLNLTL